MRSSFAIIYNLKIIIQPLPSWTSFPFTTFQNCGNYFLTTNKIQIVRKTSEFEESSNTILSTICPILSTAVDFSAPPVWQAARESQAKFTTVSSFFPRNMFPVRWWCGWCRCHQVIYQMSVCYSGSLLSSSPLINIVHVFWSTNKIFLFLLPRGALRTQNSVGNLTPESLLRTFNQVQTTKPPFTFTATTCVEYLHIN